MLSSSDDEDPLRRIEDDSESFEGTSDSHVDPVTLDGSRYRYTSQLSPDLHIDLEHRPERGLSFQIWPSSLSLARYAEIEDRHESHCWQGKRVLELGCGCGLVGLCFAALGADVLLTDLPDPLDIVRDNIALNSDTIASAGGNAAAQAFVWGKTDVSELTPEWRTPDIIVAADVVYRRELFQPLLHALKSLGGSHGTRILLSHVRRWKSDKFFFQQARKHWAVTDISECLDPTASQFAPHSRGALRLFEFKQRRLQ
ncbi:probable EEF1A lysine methyltransferase 3 [Coccomyxa sp. Obi]|nr:probable EEF1A lysine methyltransferase 3 [Coccomyxa sp. Obi]